MGDSRKWWEEEGKFEEEKEHFHSGNDALSNQEAENRLKELKDKLDEFEKIREKLNSDLEIHPTEDPDIFEIKGPAVEALEKKLVALDNVDSPKHYTLFEHCDWNFPKEVSDLEAIDIIRASLTEEEFKGFCKGNILKYMLRHKHKNGDEDIAKVGKYQHYLTEM